VEETRLADLPGPVDIKVSLFLVTVDLVRVRI
jgi:hypothetical protein